MVEKIQDLVSVRSLFALFFPFQGSYSASEPETAKAGDNRCLFLSAVMSPAVCNDRLFSGRLK